MKVAAIQMNSSGQVDLNLSKTEALLIQAKDAGADICFLPENFAFMGYPKELLNSVMEDEETGPIQAKISNIAKEHQIWIIAGSIPIKDSETGKSLSRSVTFNDEGQIKGFYDKVHLFDVEVNGRKYHESEAYNAGTEVKTVSTPWFKIGLSICYDLRFPELYRSQEFKDIEVISVPSAFTKETGEAHWMTLLQSRAIENLAYVVAPNQCGEHVGSRKTFGHSVILDPWGEIMDLKKDGEGFALAEIDIEGLKSIRSKFPALEHRKL
jgi:nitrilase